MVDTVLGGAIDFLQKFGFFDVILPFLLVFTIVFGVLEKTRIFGTEKIGGEDLPKKNINAMVAFTIAFFVIATKEVVTIIQVSLPKIALLLLIIISFMMLAGSIMSSEKEFSVADHKWLVGIMTGAILIAVLALFFEAIGWLDIAIGFFSGIGQSTLIAIVFLVALSGIIYYIVSPPGGSGGSE